MVNYDASYPSKTSWKLRLTVTETTLDAANNRSFVSWELRIVRGNNDTPFNDEATLYQAVAPGGFTSNFPAYRFGSSGSGTNYSATPVGGTVLIAEGGAWVEHDPDGSGSVNVNAIHHAGSTLGTATPGTKTFTLTKLTQKPGTPDDVTLAYVSDTAATLTWDNNYASNGVPTTNQIQTSVNGAAFGGTSSVAATESLGITVAANQKITARVRASNSAGSSSYSSASNAIYTTPAAPSNVTATKDANQDITISWTSNVGFSEHEHVIEHGTISGGVTTWDGSPLTTVVSGTSSYKHSSPNAAQIHVYRVYAKNTDTAGRTSTKTLSNSVQLLAAPNPPTLPVLGPYVDEAADFDLTWTHNPVDTTPQSAYEVGYSTNGGSSWSTTGKQTSTTSEYTFSGGTYDPDDELTVRVRTWGQATSGGADGTGASEWSDPQTVTFKTAPVVSITSPADEGTWTESDLTVELGFSQDEGASFVRATIVLSQGSTVLETKQTTTLAGTLLDTEVENGGTYTLTVTALDSNGLVSAEAEAEFDVEYTLPVEAGVDISWLEATGWSQLDLTFPDPEEGEAAAVAVTILRTIDGVTETVFSQYPVEGSSMSFLDTTPTVNGKNTFTVRTISDDGAAADVVVDLEVDETEWAYLSTGPGYGDVVSFASNLSSGSVPYRQHSLFRAAGRTKRIAQFGEGQDLGVGVTATIVPGMGSSWQEIERFINTAGLVCYREPSGRRVFGTITGSITGVSALGAELQFTVTEAS